MQEENTTEFKIRFDDDDNDEVVDEKLSVFPEEPETNEIVLLRKRVSRLAFMLFLLICVLAGGAVYFYLDLENRVSGKGPGGVQTLEKLSERLESGLSSLSVKQARLESSLEKARAAAESGLKVQIEAMTPLKKELAMFREKLPEITTSLTALKKDVDTMKARVATLQNGFNSMKKEADALGNRVILSEQTIYKTINDDLKSFAREITARATEGDNDLEAALTDLENELAPLRQNLADAFAQLETLDRNLDQKIQIVAGDVENNRLAVSRLEGKITDSPGVAKKSLDDLDARISRLSRMMTDEKIEEKLRLKKIIDKMEFEAFKDESNSRMDRLESKLEMSRKPGRREPAPPARPNKNGIIEEDLR